MAESPEQMHARCADHLQLPPLHEWESWPFVGDVTPKALEPLTPEPDRQGEGGVDCAACARPDADYVWTNAHWRLTHLGPSGLPLILLLEPRLHVDAPSDLPDELAGELGVLLGRVERAMLTVETIARVHQGRWGEGAEHLHWWFLGRPAGFGQLRSSFAEIWDGILPATPPDVWEANVAQVVAALG